MLHASTESLQSTTERLLMGLDAKVNRADQLLSSTHQNSSALGSAVKIFAGLAGIGILGIAAIFIRSRREQSKKFV
jgi:hypothetical protein